MDSTLGDYHALLKQKKGFAPGQTSMEVDEKMEDEEADTITDEKEESSGLIQSSLHPFLVVNSVVENSPSHTANLKIYDQIVKFGDIKLENFVGLKQIGEHVRHNEDQNMTIAFIRPSEGANMIQFTSLVPKKWAGKGLLGCVVNTI